MKIAKIAKKVPLIMRKKSRDFVRNFWMSTMVLPERRMIRQRTRGKIAINKYMVSPMNESSGGREDRESVARITRRKEKGNSAKIVSIPREKASMREDVAWARVSIKRLNLRDTQSSVVFSPLGPNLL